MWSSVPAHRWAPEHKGLTISPNDGQSFHICLQTASQWTTRTSTQRCATSAKASCVLVVRRRVVLVRGTVEVALWSVFCICICFLWKWPCGQWSCFVVLIFNSGLTLIHADSWLGLFLWTNVQTPKGALYVTMCHHPSAPNCLFDFHSSKHHIS